MGLTELFNEWIVERGSAKVQEKHIAFFRDQLAAADKKTALLEKKITELETEIENLKSDLKESQNENEILRNKIQKYEQPAEQSTHCNLLDESKVNILKHLFKHDNQQIQHIAQALQIEVQLAKYHVEELLKVKKVKNNTIYRQEVHQGYVGTTTRQIPVPVLNIDQDGRKY